MRCNIFLSFVIVFSLGLFLASCSGFKQMEIDKRHYRNGFYIHHAGNVNNNASLTTTADAAIETVSPVSSGVNTNTEAVANTTSATQEKNAAAPVLPVVSSATTSAIAPVERQSVNPDVVKEQLPITIHHDHLPAAGDDMFIVEIILCFLLPCVAVLIHEGGLNERFWIALLLMVLLWVPGVIYALLVCLDAI